MDEFGAMIVALGKQVKNNVDVQEGLKQNCFLFYV